MRAESVLKPLTLVVAMAAGFFIGKGFSPAGTVAGGGMRWEAIDRTSAADPSATHKILPPPVGKTVPDRSPPGSLLTETLKFERYLATCDLALFPQLLDEAYHSSTSFDRSVRIGRAWAERDIDGYVAWALTQPEHIEFGATGSGLRPTRAPVVWMLAKKDPLAAMAIADRLLVHENDKWRILQTAMKEDPATALLLAEAHPDIYLQQQWGTRASSHSGIEPMKALPVVQRLHPGGGRVYFANDGVNYYTAHPDKFEEAETWFQQLPEDAQRAAVATLEYQSALNPDSAKLLPRLRDLWSLPEE